MVNPHPDSDPTAGRARPVRSVALSHLVVIVDSLVVALWIGASRYRSFIPCPVRHGPDRLAPVPFRFAPVPKRPPSLPPSRAPLPRPPPPPLKWTCLLPPPSSLLCSLASNGVSFSYMINEPRGTTLRRRRTRRKERKKDS